LFLDSKSIYYAVDGFEFFVLTENAGEQETLGFFSREMNSWDDYNVACILIFPPYQSRGLGRLLIAFSYYLYRIDGKVGAPEKPLSDYGHASYIAYWTIATAQVILSISDDDIHRYDSITISDLSMLTAIREEDIVEALDKMNVSQRQKGRKSILVKSIRLWAETNGISLKPLIDEEHDCIIRRLKND
jgi:hypothetical protein